MEQNQYFLHHQPDRTQLLKHYYSSLQQPNLQNIQSQLQMTRSRNYQLGASYFQQKYGNSRIYANLMKQLDLQPKKQQIQQKYKPRVIQNKKQYEEYLKAKLKQKQQEIKQQFNQQKGIKKVKVSKGNPWSQHKNKEIERDNVNEIKQQKYISDFMKFRQKKQQRDKSKEVENHKEKIKEVKKRNYKKQLIQKIYKQLDNKNKGYIQKIQFLQYLTENPKLFPIFNINQSDASTELYKLKTKNLQTLTLKQMFYFFSEQQQSQIYNFGMTNQSQKNQQQTKYMAKGCLLSPQTFQSFEKVFKQLDKYSDMIVKRKQYIQKLRQSIYVKQILYEPAIFEEKVNRTILLYRILDKIQQEQYIGNQQQRKSKQYISFNQFKNYFLQQNKENQLERLKKVRFLDFMNRFNADKKQNIIQVPKQIIQILQNIYNQTPQVNGYFKTLDFLQKIKKSDQFHQNKQTTVRNKDPKFGLDQQNFEATINRIAKQAPNYIQFSQLLEYFSRIGRSNQYIMNKLKKQKYLQKNLKGSKIIQQQYQHLIQDDNDIVGYDSDPQFYNNSSKLKNSRAFLQNQRILRKDPQNQTHDQIKQQKNVNSKFISTFIQNNQNQKNPKQKSLIKNIRQHSESLQFIGRNQNIRPKITVPQPFSFQYRQQKKKSSNQYDNKQQYKFKARELPKTSLQVGLYDKIMEENDKRRQQIKKNSMIITLATEKPFSFQNKQKIKARKKNSYQREQFIFKAKPVPWFCSIDLYTKYTLQNQITRKQKISKMAQQSLALAKLPPRMQKNQLQKKAKKLRESGDYDLKQNKAFQIIRKDPPDFERLQKIFQQELERKKQSIRPTQVKPFKFSDPVRTNKLKSQESFEVIRQQIKSQKKDAIAKKLRQQQPNIRAASTLKFTQQVQKRRKQIQQKQKKQLQKNRYEQQLKNRQSLKPRLMKTDAVNYKPAYISKKVEQKKKQEIQQQKKFELWRKQRILNAKAQPLLVERPLKRDQQLQKMKKLAMINQTLEQNGVKGKEKEALFTKEELILLKDYEYLKKNKHI